MKSAGLNKTSRVRHAKERDYRAQIIHDLLNVTWRMLFPTLIGIAIGMIADAQTGMSPVGFLIGAVVGFVIGSLLAIRLLKQAESIR